MEIEKKMDVHLSLVIRDMPDRGDVIDKVMGSLATSLWRKCLTKDRSGHHDNQPLHIEVTDFSLWRASSEGHPVTGETITPSAPDPGAPIPAIQLPVEKKAWISHALGKFKFFPNKDDL